MRKMRTVLKWVTFFSVNDVCQRGDGTSFFL